MRNTIGLVMAVAAIAYSRYALASSEDPIPFPAEFREWAHVKSVLVGPQAPSFATEAGIHHIYANPKAMEGYRSGRFPDGSVVVYNLLEIKETAGLTLEGPTRRVDVMVKDGTRYRETGGWGFARFMSDDRSTGALTAEAQRRCFECHSKRKERDAVFSEFRQ